MKFKIISVDHFGYNGREHHPADSDIGLVVVPLKMEALFIKNGELAEDMIQQESANGFFLNQEAIPYLFTDDPDSYLETMFTCVTKDGRILDLMDFEIELIA